MWHVTLCLKLDVLACCGAVGYASGLRDIEQRPSTRMNSPSSGARDYTGDFSMWHVTLCLKLVVLPGVGLWAMRPG